MGDVSLLAPAMFVVAFALIFTGFPVAFSLGGTALIFAVLGVAFEVFDWGLLGAFPQRTFGVMGNYVLLAVPFFIFMGTMLERSKLAEDLLTTIGVLFGGLRGGLALAVVFVGALLAAATGVVGASVVAMGMISLPVMQRYQYDPSVATGTIAAAGTLAQIVQALEVLHHDIDPRVENGQIYLHDGWRLRWDDMHEGLRALVSNVRLRDSSEFKKQLLLRFQPHKVEQYVFRVIGPAREAGVRALRLHQRADHNPPSRAQG